VPLLKKEFFKTIRVQRPARELLFPHTTQDIPAASAFNPEEKFAGVLRPPAGQLPWGQLYNGAEK
jgi:hypothetical protein